MKAETTSKTLNLNGLKSIIFSKKGSMILLIIGFAGIALILLSDFWPSKSAAKTAVSATAGATTTAAYAKQLESDLTTIIGKIDGVGRIHVMVTVQSSVQYIYEQSEKTSNNKSVTSQSDGGTQNQETTDSEENPVVIQNDSGGQQALIKTELQPEVMGVVVVCDGGDNPVVQENVINAVMTALDMPANHISVCKMSGK